MYQCKLPWVPAADGTWNPVTAINVTSVKRSVSSTEHGTLFTIDVRFTAPESRTCYIDFGKHRGFSPQAYPNPSPVSPPAAPNNTVISRVVLPVLERAGFGVKPQITGPLIDRDPIFASRIYAHRRSFDGEFVAQIVYSVPQQNATQPSVLVELTCNFDVVDRHTPLLASIISKAPEWTGFTPYSNRLSTVTLSDVHI
ncbi:hypothetical protein EC988_004815 [Linderina pennispora]|nr:hypothetical protein EC988_004815 [Linderina pennispora]